MGNATCRSALEACQTEHFMLKDRYKHMVAEPHRRANVAAYIERDEERRRRRKSTTKARSKAGDDSAAEEAGERSTAVRRRRRRAQRKESINIYSEMQQPEEEETKKDRAALTMAEDSTNPAAALTNPAAESRTASLRSEWRRKRTKKKKALMGGGGLAVVEYPGGREERVEGGRVTALEFMVGNPGFFLLCVDDGGSSPASCPSPDYSSFATTTPRSFSTAATSSFAASAFLANSSASSRMFPRCYSAARLLPPDATLSSGTRYRLVTFEEVFLRFSGSQANIELTFSPMIRSTQKMQLLQQTKKQNKKLSFNSHENRDGRVSKRC